MDERTRPNLALPLTIFLKKADTKKYEYIKAGPCHPVMWRSWLVKRMMSSIGLKTAEYRLAISCENTRMSLVTRWSLRHPVCESVDARQSPITNHEHEFIDRGWSIANSHSRSRTRTRT